MNLKYFACFCLFLHPFATLVGTGRALSTPLPAQHPTNLPAQHATALPTTHAVPDTIPTPDRPFTFVQLNCENLFDCRHDSLKNDYEYLPDAKKKWDSRRYWRKLNNIAREIIACGNPETVTTPHNAPLPSLPDMVALCEVENDSVLVALTRRSLLRNARYDYVMTDSPDQRGIDVALLYSPFAFRLLGTYSLRIVPPDGLHPTRDVLYAYGQTISGDTLHILVAHAPSRRGGRKASEEYRTRLTARLMASVDSIRALSPDARILVAGDFNAYSGEKCLQPLLDGGLTELSADAKGLYGAKGTYKYMGEWGSLDHIYATGSLAASKPRCVIGDFPFLMENDKKYGGRRPRRTYIGPRYQNGFSDHLPLILTF